MEQVTTLTDMWSNMQPGPLASVLHSCVVSRAQLASISEENSIFKKRGESVSHARLVKEFEMKSFFYHPRPVGPAEPATSAEAKGEKRAALSIRLEPDSRWEHRELSK